MKREYDAHTALGGNGVTDRTKKILARLLGEQVEVRSHGTCLLVRNDGDARIYKRPLY